MAGLGTFIEGFLAADGFAVMVRKPGFVVAERMAEGEFARRHVWFADPDNGVQPRESDLLAAFSAERGAGGAVDQAFFVAPSLTGLSNGFRQKAAELGVGVRVPIQFFDTPYKTDGDASFGSGRGGEARSVFAEFVAENATAIAERVPQPFVALSALGEGNGGFASGPDLLGPLVERLSAPPDAAGITIVIGSAGAGKSCLFAALFQALDRRFAEEKRGQRLASRPILFLPGHIRETSERSLDGLLTAVARTDAAAPTGAGLMRWLCANGLTIWMFDGLDEFFAGEADFVAALEQALTAESRARIVICARDSLLTTSTALRRLVDRHMASGAVHVFELARWERASQRTLAWLRLEGRAPGNGEADTQKVGDFLATLDASPALAELATLPYYCDLLLAERPQGNADLLDEFDLLAAAVDGLIDREAGKLSSGELGFDWDVFSGADAFVDASDIVGEFGAATFNDIQHRQRMMDALRTVGRERLVELIEGIAHRMRTLDAYPNDAKGLPVADLEQLAGFYLDVGLFPDIEPRVLLALVQFAFFGPGREAGFVRFSHEIVADYLAGRHALAMIRARPESADALGQAVGVRRDIERTVLFRFLVREIGRDPELAAIVHGHVAQGRVRANYAGNAQLLARALGT